MLLPLLLRCGARGAARGHVRCAVASLWRFADGLHRRLVAHAPPLDATTPFAAPTLETTG